MRFGGWHKPHIPLRLLELIFNVFRINHNITHQLCHKLNTFSKLLVAVTTQVFQSFGCVIKDFVCRICRSECLKLGLSRLLLFLEPYFRVSVFASQAEEYPAYFAMSAAMKAAYTSPATANNSRHSVTVS